jgi:hypothetical protein
VGRQQQQQQQVAPHTRARIAATPSLKIRLNRFPGLTRTPFLADSYTPKRLTDQPDFMGWTAS